MNESIFSISRFLLEKDNFIIAIHANPDGDCYGSACALCSALEKLGKGCAILSPMPIPKRLEFLNYGGFDVYVGEDGLKSLQGSHTYISVDVASDHLLDTLSEFYNQNNAFAIDHHSANTITAKRKYVDPSASATGEIVYAIICQLEEISDTSLLDEQCASSVFGAISSDTGCFKYSNVTPDTHIIASELIKKGAYSADINYRLFDLKSSVQISVEALSYRKLEFYFDGKVSFIYLSDTELCQIGANTSDTETVCQLGRGIEGVQIAAFMRQKEQGLYKISVRSNNDADMSLLCSSFGIGGGHKKAAGCSIYAESAEEAKALFLSKCTDYLE